jgi:hypothetical protein
MFMSRKFEDFIPTIEKVYEELKNSTNNLSSSDFGELSQFTNIIIEKQSQKLGSNGWSKLDLKDLEIKVIEFWDSFSDIFVSNSEFLECCIGENMFAFKKLWSFNHFYGWFYPELINQAKKNATSVSANHKLIFNQ